MIGIISFSIILMVLCILIIAGVLTSIQRQINKMARKLNRLNRMVRKISPEEGIDGGSGSSEHDQEIIDLLDRGKKIQAIKKAREYYGFDLKEAKDYVERL